MGVDGGGSLEFLADSAHGLDEDLACFGDWVADHQCCCTHRFGCEDQVEALLKSVLQVDSCQSAESPTTANLGRPAIDPEQ